MNQVINYQDIINLSEDNYDSWLETINPIKDISPIIPFFQKIGDEYTGKERFFKLWNLQGLVFRKFVAPCEMNSYYSQKNVPTSIDTKSDFWFDITDYPNKELTILPNENLQSLSVNISRTHSIDVSLTPNLKALNIANCRNFQNIKMNNDLQFLFVSRCPNLSDFSQFSECRNLIWVGFNHTKLLKDISFMENFQNLVIADLLDLDILDNPTTLATLKKLKNLRHLLISAKTIAKKKQLEIYRNELPHCNIN